MVEINLITIDSSILSILILLFIYVSAYNNFNKIFTSYKLFISLVLVNIFILIIDIFAWVFNRLSGNVYLYLNTGLNLLLYIVVPIAPLLWVLYIDYQILHDDKRTNALKRIVVIPFILNAVLSVISLYTKWYFYVDSNNVYHRGNYFLIYLLFCNIPFVYSFLFILLLRKNIEKKYFYTLLLFYIPEVLGSTLQAFFYGLSTNWIGMMLSLLIIYFHIQDSSLSIDYLTGAYNRLQLDFYMKYMIKNSQGGKSFSAILIDLNDFKSINDTYGHSTGDEALIESVKILKKCINNNDFLARFGGDEFLIILNINSNEELENAVKNIRESISIFNNSNKKQYKLSFAMGYAIYDANSGMDADSFFRYIDQLMYIDKSQTKLINLKKDLCH